jgi:D-alanine transaminase
MSRIAYTNGRYVRQADAMINIEDRGYQFADGVYEVIAVVNGQLVDGEQHFDRLERSLEGLHMDPPCSRQVLVLIMMQVLRRNHIKQGIVYLQITRGVAPRNHPFPVQDTASSLVVTASRKHLPTAADVARGAKVVTVPESRWSRPDIKSVSLLPNVLAKQDAVEQGAYEAWFVDKEGFITEGSSTNAWIVLNGKEIVTRPLSRDILAGITRQTIMSIARESNLVVTERSFSVDEAKAAKEAFVTSTTSLVMPVIAIDDAPVGDGKPGDVALQLYNAYRHHMKQPSNGR